MGLGTMHKGRHRDPVARRQTGVAAMFCIKCGDDLRGLSVEDRCPTCRHPIYDSVYGGYLVDARNGSRADFTKCPRSCTTRPCFWAG